jgi:hypothetical protein
MEKSAEREARRQRLARRLYVALNVEHFGLASMDSLYAKCEQMEMSEAWLQIADDAWERYESMIECLKPEGVCHK